MKYFSMFTGVGGFELGIGDKGECVGFSEINKYCSDLLLKQFPTVRNWGDCSKIEPGCLPDFDMLCGGFPCQTFSIAGKRAGFNDTRGTMFFEVARIAKAKRPKIIFLENVKGLLNHNKGETFKVILETLDELGYETQWMVLNSKFFGVPQNRERVFIIGSLIGQPRPEILPFRQDSQETYETRTGNISRTIGAGYSKLQNTASYIKYFNMSKSQHHRIYEQEGISPTLAGASKLSGDCTPKIVASRGRNPNNPSDRTIGAPTEQRLEENSEGISNSLTSVEKDNMILEIANSVTPDAYLTRGTRDRDESGKAILTSMNARRIRRLTPVECERLQGFPDNWTEGFSDTQRYKMMGNAVTVKVISAIIKRIILEKE